MTRNLNAKRIYGLTVRQWSTLLIVTLALILFGCRFFYNIIRNQFAPADQSNNQSAPGSNDDSRQKGSPRSSGDYTVAEATAHYLKLGNPTAANQNDPNNFLMVNSAYALSYNRQRATANWVAWTVTPNDLGDAARSNDFRPDDRLPNDWLHVAPNDYTASGFDRGHLCPSADRSNAPENNSATFLMTNITPQTPDLNRGVWERLESYSRDLVKQGNELYIVSGVYGNAGKIKNKIVIPTNFWKVIVVLPNNFNDDLSKINSNTRVIAVDMPNINGVKNDDWHKYRVPVREIEQRANVNLFSNVSSNVQNVFKTRQDSQ